MRKGDQSDGEKFLCEQAEERNMAHSAPHMALFLVLWIGGLFLLSFVIDVRDHIGIFCIFGWIVVVASWKVVKMLWSSARRPYDR